MRVDVLSAEVQIASEIIKNIQTILISLYRQDFFNPIFWHPETMKNTNKQARKLQDAQAEKLTSLQADKLTS